MPATKNKPVQEETSALVPKAPTPPETADPRPDDVPPSRAEFDLLAAQVRQLAAQLAHGRA